MDTIIILTILGLGMIAELTLGQPELWATGASLVVASIYMLVATLVLLSRRPAHAVMTASGSAGRSEGAEAVK